MSEESRWLITPDEAGWWGLCRKCGFEALWGFHPPQESDECPECSKKVSPTYTIEQVEEAVRYLYGLMNESLRATDADWEYNIDEAWGHIKKHIASQQGDEKE